jgi:hypothetical protein
MDFNIIIHSGHITPFPPVICTLLEHWLIISHRENFPKLFLDFLKLRPLRHLIFIRVLGVKNRKFLIMGIKYSYSSLSVRALYNYFLTAADSRAEAGSSRLDGVLSLGGFTDLHILGYQCEIRGGRSVTGAGLSQRFFGFPMLIIPSPWHHTHLSLPSAVCDSPHHAAHYHFLDL